MALAFIIVFKEPSPVVAQALPTSQPSSQASSPQITAPASTASPRPRPTKGPVRIAFAGDVHFEGEIRPVLDADPASVFRAVAPTLRSADLAIANLETAITTRGAPQPKQYTFRAPVTAFQALRSAGFSVVSMANNHGVDYGPVGLQDSLRAIEASHFPVIGIGKNATQAYRPYATTVHGERISFLAATQVLDEELQARWTATDTQAGIASAKPLGLERLLAAVRAARKSSDTVIVYLHWGTELVPCPTYAQRSLARALISAGADIVAGSHAHILLGHGFLGRAYIDYGLGNFVFYARPGVTSQTGILILSVQGRRILSSTWTPAVIVSGIPRPLSGTAAQAASSTAERLRACTDLTSG